MVVQTLVSFFLGPQDIICFVKAMSVTPFRFPFPKCIFSNCIFPKCIFPWCILPKCSFAKCTRLACLLSFASLFHIFVETHFTTEQIECVNGLINEDS